MKQIFLFFSILFAFTSCDNDDLPITNVQYSSIAKGDSFPNDQSIAPRYLVIKNSKSWNNLMTEMSTPNNLVKEFSETNIDFNKYQIIAVIDRTNGNGGHSIDIMKISQNRKTVIVKVEKLKKGDLTARLSRPYDIVKIEKTNKKVVFEQ
ncbi:protease complex subunit PrcB family protein [Flavobacterium phragmitis]|uniref:PrcB C-terminal n=1 Tax=Flavobacterium phragmitis TaxID=739143 RepID=A0A1I1JP06_9FLAO|nr:protease complex subunit PrcB family protein [Flavobacterium phragmitis]SFC50216.1 hypothetical protein SAMN05216297_10147 [Flavobacterium phragmitis]